MHFLFVYAAISSTLPLRSPVDRRLYFILSWTMCVLFKNDLLVKTNDCHFVFRAVIRFKCCMQK